ncbi:GNAT family N-acetyltransferase [Georgenia thermotolerans]|uniref:GNAT family N-acetyltransferase n=2 Tax=Georgenia thermotolerans TaxID=527326 RepID=A0A7J5UMF2_9MICO|nr:GNAT family N-acetyltransferase [Georgenia thermotolerans]
MTLEPLSLEHVDELAQAVAEDGLWKRWYTNVPAPEQMGDEIERRLARHAAGDIVPWTVRRASDGRAVGMTTYCNMVEEHRRLEIGYTWLAVSAQRTGINTEAKLHLLSRAFDTLGCIAVEFCTHWHNQQSRRAIAGLGAKQDGVLRNHRIGRDGTLRDTVVFSIIASEWPTVRLSLTEKLARAREQAPVA